MKYLVILILVVLLVRIDWILRRFDLLSEKLTSKQTEVEPIPENSDREIVPLSKDKIFKQNPKQIFLGLLDDFQSSPSADVRQRAVAYLKEHPSLFMDTLDRELEAAIYQWRDLFILNNPEVSGFLLELSSILPGKNKLLIYRFFSLWMDINMEHFLAAYAKGADTNCNIAIVFGDEKSETEIKDSLLERAENLRKILENENMNPQIKQLATNCLLKIDLEINATAAETLPGTNP